MRMCCPNTPKFRCSAVFTHVTTKLIISCNLTITFVDPLVSCSSPMDIEAGKVDRLKRDEEYYLEWEFVVLKVCAVFTVPLSKTLNCILYIAG